MEGGFAGQTVEPVRRAGCYAPGGRYPLPSSVLMTACTARVAGVAEVIVASPHPAEVTKAAAYVADADCLLAVGGAQAVAALAHGVGVKPCDIIVGPGNQYVTAAKSIVNGLCGRSDFGLMVWRPCPPRSSPHRMTSPPCALSRKKNLLVGTLPNPTLPSRRCTCSWQVFFDSRLFCPSRSEQCFQARMPFQGL